MTQCCADNEITKLPDFFANDGLPALTELNINHNPITSPPQEVISRGLESIQGYFKAFRLGTARHQELKVVVLGAAEAGKTSLLRGARGGTRTQPHERTELLDVQQWSPHQIKPVKLRCVDIGGQPIYFKLTCRFFLSGRAVYVLVVDLARYVSQPGLHRELVQFWLDQIQAQVPGAVVLIVATKCDLLPDADQRTSAVEQMVNRIQRSETRAVQLLAKEEKMLEEQLEQHSGGGARSKQDEMAIGCKK